LLAGLTCCLHKGGQQRPIGSSPGLLFPSRTHCSKSMNIEPLLVNLNPLWSIILMRRSLQRFRLFYNTSFIHWRSSIQLPKPLPPLRLRRRRQHWVLSLLQKGMIETNRNQWPPNGTIPLLPVFFSPSTPRRLPSRSSTNEQPSAKRGKWRTTILPNMRLQILSRSPMESSKRCHSENRRAAPLVIEVSIHNMLHILMWFLLHWQHCWWHRQWRMNKPWRRCTQTATPSNMEWSLMSFFSVWWQGWSIWWGRLWRRWVPTQEGFPLEWRRMSTTMRRYPQMWWNNCWIGVC